MDKNQQYKRVFDCFDENKDGKLSPIELQRCMASIGGESFNLSLDDAHEAILRMGSGDGLLSFEDIVTLLEDGSEEEKDRELKEAFTMYEMDGCGYITPKSLKRMLSRLGESRSIDDCKKMIACYDLNGDGLLNFDEFQVMMSY